MTSEVLFTELPLAIILLSLAFSVSPLLEPVLQVILLAKILAYLGYRRITTANLLHNENRERIFRCIQEHPGIFFSSILQETGLRPGTLRYHLLLLQSQHKICTLSGEGHARYFENADTFTPAEMRVLKFLRNRTDHSILRLLMGDPDLNRKELSLRLGISASMVTWYMSRLSGAGLIIQKKAGKEVRYVITPIARQILEKYPVPEDTVPVISATEDIPESG